MSSSMSFTAPQLVARVAGETISDVLPDSSIAEVRYDAAQQGLTSPRVQMRRTQGTAILRQRFYPAQLRRLLNCDLMALSASRKCRLTWVGWDRSLPRMYLPVEPLLRLVIDAVDGITAQFSSGASATTSIKFRVEYQKIANSTLVLSLDADQWQCNATFRGALNARWFRPSRQAQLWQRLARQCDTVGGWLSVANLPGGGASLLINLPTDQPIALLHSWLSRRFASLPSSKLSLYAIGRNRIETVEEVHAANVRLQSLSRGEDFIYRTCHGRWIWLTTAAGLPTFLETAPWLSERLDCWTCGNDSGSIFDLATRVDARFRELMGNRIPPLDLRTHAMSRGPVTMHRPNTRVDQPAQVSPSNHLNRHAKWRYPI